MKKLMNTLLLISLFVVFTSSTTTSSETSLTENQISLDAECSNSVLLSLNELIGPPQMEIANQDPFCFYYFELANMYCTAYDMTGEYEDFLQCTYYLTLYADNCIIE